MKQLVSILTNLLGVLISVKIKCHNDMAIINRVKDIEHNVFSMSTEELIQELDNLAMDIYEAGANIYVLASTDEERTIASRYSTACDAIWESIEAIKQVSMATMSTEELIQELNKLAMDIYEAGADIYTLASTDEERNIASIYCEACDVVWKCIETIKQDI